MASSVGTSGLGCAASHAGLVDSAASSRPIAMKPRPVSTGNSMAAPNSSGRARCQPARWPKAICNPRQPCTQPGACRASCRPSLSASHSAQAMRVQVGASACRSAAMRVATTWPISRHKRRRDSNSDQVGAGIGSAAASVPPGPGAAVQADRMPTSNELACVRPSNGAPGTRRTCSSPAACSTPKRSGGRRSRTASDIQAPTLKAVRPPASPGPIIHPASGWC